MISLKNVVCAVFYVYIFDFITHFYNPLYLLHLHLLTLIGIDPPPPPSLLRVNIKLFFIHYCVLKC